MKSNIQLQLANFLKSQGYNENFKNNLQPEAGLAGLSKLVNLFGDPILDKSS